MVQNERTPESLVPQVSRSQVRKRQNTLLLQLQEGMVDPTLESSQERTPAQEIVFIEQVQKVVAWG